MRIDTFLEAQKLYNKYSLCESLLEYLSDEEKPQGQKYLETLKMFVNVFPYSFMMFVHDKMTEMGEQFEALQCCDKQPEENPEQPAEPKEPKFAIGSKVEIVGGVYNGTVGQVYEFDPANSNYYVINPKVSMWFPEAELQAYVEESEEQPEIPEEDGGTTEAGEGE